MLCDHCKIMKNDMYGFLARILVLSSMETRFYEDNNCQYSRNYFIVL